ncbi:MAG: 30S ribosomal protein S9 [Candidatus Paceibacterota bacterium]|jgi:small subunit ribosomal protein S9
MATKTKKIVSKETKKKTLVQKTKYIESIGRRKEAIARVRLSKDPQGIVINDKTLEQYFPLLSMQNKVLFPFKEVNLENNFFISIKVKGGGTTGQAEAIRLGISRCLAQINEKIKPLLREKGLLTRDSRVVERKKYGLKKARKSPQWHKR